VFYHRDKNKNLRKQVEHLTHATFVPYKDFADLQKQLNTYSGYQTILIANEEDIPALESYILKKKEQTYMIKLNPSDDHQENPKIRKNLLLSAYSEDEVATFLIDKLGEHMEGSDRNPAKPREGKNYALKYQPTSFGTSPRFPNQTDYVPLKNDPLYSTRGVKSVSRESNVYKSETIRRELSPRVVVNSPYYNR
jgi:hypothetical protein